jgi:hypothetical protein
MISTSTLRDESDERVFRLRSASSYFVMTRALVCTAVLGTHSCSHRIRLCSLTTFALNTLKAVSIQRDQRTRDLQRAQNITNRSFALLNHTSAPVDYAEQFSWLTHHYELIW